MYQYEYLIGEDDISPQYEHVHHAHSLRFLERGRLQFLEAIECSNESLIATGVFSVIVRIEVDYKREVFKGPIRVTCEGFEVQGKTLRLRQRLYNHRGKEALNALIELKFMDGKSRFAVEVPQKIVTALGVVAKPG